MKYIFLFCLVIVLMSCQEKGIYRFEIGEGDGFSQSGPVSLDISFIERQNIGQFQLMQNGKAIPFQLEGNSIWFVHQQGQNTSYSLEKLGGNNESPSPGFRTMKENGNLKLLSGGKDLVTYRYGMTYPPEGVDSIFKKSGYVHPILTPKGDTLTQIQPPDHYHHYGLWGPWTHTRIDTTRVDFWNLGQGMGTVLFKEFKETVSGNVFTSLTAVQEHIDLKTSDSPQVALLEDLEVKLWDLGNSDRYLLDYTTKFSSPLESGILFEAYRYGGGMGLRFTERWHKDNCIVLTSEGKDRATADGSKAKWCIIKGESADGKGTIGVLFMSHPENRAHPEPMRVWPIDVNRGRGDMFFEFCPIRHKEWKIEPDKKYQLNYRMVVFDGDLKPEEAEAYWQAFAHPLEVVMITN